MLFDQIQCYFTVNKLTTDFQQAYREGHGTMLNDEETHTNTDTRIRTNTITNSLHTHTDTHRHTHTL
jgi:hypothetical protein